MSCCLGVRGWLFIILEVDDGGVLLSVVGLRLGDESVSAG